MQYPPSGRRGQPGRIFGPYGASAAKRMGVGLEPQLTLELTSGLGPERRHVVENILRFVDPARIRLGPRRLLPDAGIDRLQLRVAPERRHRPVNRRSDTSNSASP